MKKLIAALLSSITAFSATPFTDQATDAVQYNATNKNVRPNGLNQVFNTLYGTNFDGITLGRQLSDRIKDVYNVKDSPYSARGNGIANDSASIQLALNYAKTNGGGAVYFPSGTYIAEALDVPSNVRIYGEGVLKYPNNTTNFYIFQADTKSNVVIEGLTFNGNIAGQSSYSEFRHCIKIMDSSNVTIKGNTLSNIIGDGIYISHSDLAVAPYTGSKNVNIYNNNFIGTSANRNGISVICVDSCLISGNYFEKMANSLEPGAIDLEPDNGNEFVKHVRISNNNIIGHNLTDLNLQQGVSVNNNTFNATVQDIVICNNTISGNFRYGLSFFCNTTAVDTILTYGNTIVGNNNPAGIGIINFKGLWKSLSDNVEASYNIGIWDETGSSIINSPKIIGSGLYGIRLDGTNTIVTDAWIQDAGNHSTDGARGGIYLNGKYNRIHNAYIFSTLAGGASTTNTLQGIYAPDVGASNNILTGLNFLNIGSKNYNIAGPQIWGINYARNSGASLDTVQERKVTLFPNSQTTDTIIIAGGGTSSSYSGILLDSGVVRSVKADNSGYTDFYAQNINSISGTITAPAYVHSGSIGDTVAYFDASHNLISSTITITELLKLAGVSGGIQTNIDNRAVKSVTLTGVNSISGGGDLTANRTFQLVNDSASPGNSKYYGTDGSGTKGFFSFASSGEANTASNQGAGQGLFKSKVGSDLGFYTLAGAKGINISSPSSDIITISNVETNTTTICLSDTVSALTAGTDKQYWKAPYPFTLKAVKATLGTVSSSGVVTINIRKNGTTIFSTKLTVDATEDDSTTAATAYVFSTTSISDNDKLAFDVDTAGTGAKNLQVTLYHTKN